MLYNLLRACNNRYNRSRCTGCSYTANCPHDCGKCLSYVHYPDRAPAPRKYDCKRMMDYYVCKYACKYASEMYYAFSSCRDIQRNRKLNILSFGCGPCTDLLAVEQLQQDGQYHCNQVEYLGIEIDTDIWNNVHTDIVTVAPSNYNIQFVEADACQYIDHLQRVEWRPDVIVLQYVFSDMYKHCNHAQVNHFVSDLAAYIESCPRNTYVICNDINLSVGYGGGREYFDKLLHKLTCQTQYCSCHFNNSNRPNHYEYGDEYPDNSLIFGIPQYLAQYEPYETCASAQMIIKKVN